MHYQRVKGLYQPEKKALKNHDRMGLKSLQRELNQLLREARGKHRDVIEFGMQ